MGISRNLKQAIIAGVLSYCDGTNIVECKCYNRMCKASQLNGYPVLGILKCIENVFSNVIVGMYDQELIMLIQNMCSP
jgi:hypothetical protein